MPKFTDRYGLALTTTSSTAAEAYREGLDLLLAYLPEADVAFRRASEDDENFAAPRSVLAYLFWLAGQEDEAGSSAAAARRLGVTATRRERQQAAIVAERIGGDGAQAASLMREHLKEFPNDAFILALAVFAIGFGGTEPHPMASLHHLLLDVAPAYAGDWWFPAVLALCCEELGFLEDARHHAEQALALHPLAAGGAHAMAHVLYESGDHDGASDFLGPWLAACARAAPFRSHLAWHMALSELALGRLDHVDRLLVEDIAPTGVPSFTVLEDSASLLWRQRIYGEGEGAISWEELRELADRVSGRPGLPFLQAHAALVYAGAGDEAALAALVRRLRALGHGCPVSGSVVVPLAEGIGAFARGEHEVSIGFLEPVQTELVRIGGTHVQREVFEDTLLVAYLRTDRLQPALALLSHRLATRPSARDLAWRSHTPLPWASPQVTRSKSE